MNYIEYAKESEEAEIIIGGNGDKSKGYFIEPTVILTKNPKFKTMEEEIFGPVVTIYVYDKDKYEESLKLCNSTSPYGLTGSIGQQPFGGSRASGTNDKAGSLLNLIRWVTPQSIKENFNPPKRYEYPFMEEK